ncbi:MAG: preprotein translocase subunit SecE [Candidatus Omnitrophota bacterium]
MTKIILLVLAVVAIILVIKYYAAIKKFLLEVKTELGKVAWSTRDELIASTILVITVTAIMAVYIGIIDISLSKMLTILFK